jgi:catechol 2,3-dioxygenase-like lactoylglutathione lyase family enzyme
MRGNAMPVTGLDHINFHGHPALLDRMRDFYRDVVGLSEGPRPAFSRYGHWLYAGNLPVVHLIDLKDGERRDLKAVNSFDHIAFAATDAAGFVARLTALGVPYRVTSLPGMPVRQIFLQDPAGHRVELQFPPEE